MKAFACICVFLPVSLVCFSQTPAAKKQIIPVFKNKEYFFSDAVRLASAKYINCTFHLAAGAALLNVS